VRAGGAAVQAAERHTLGPSYLFMEGRACLRVRRRACCQSPARSARCGRRGTARGRVRRGRAGDDEPGSFTTMLGTGSLRSLRSSLPVMTSSEPSLAFDDVQARARCEGLAQPVGAVLRAPPRPVTPGVRGHLCRATCSYASGRATRCAAQSVAVGKARCSGPTQSSYICVGSGLGYDRGAKPGLNRRWRTSTCCRACSAASAT